MGSIVILGTPGSGKGTLAKQLEKTIKKCIVAPGELYRKEAKLGTEFGLRAKEYWGNGNLCPDEMTNELIKRTTNIWVTHMGWIFDGYPRTMVQAKYLDSIINIDLVFDISISNELAIKRLLKRATIENRLDDTEEVIQTRLNIYHSNNDAIIRYYQNEERYRKLNGNGIPEDTMNLAVQIMFERAEKKKNKGE